jgi:hypothetical protein
MVYPALLPLMRTPRLPVVDWTDAPRRSKRTRPFRRKKKSGFCACAITFQLASTIFWSRTLVHGISFNARSRRKSESPLFNICYIYVERQAKWYVLLNWKKLALAMDLSYAGHTVVHADLDTSVTSLTKRQHASSKPHSQSRVNTSYRAVEINGKLEVGWAPGPDWTLWREEKFLASVCNRNGYATIALVCRFALVINTRRKWQS